MVIKYIPRFSKARPSKIYPNWDFWFENKPSGNPGSAKAPMTTSTGQRLSNARREHRTARRICADDKDLSCLPHSDEI
jgi:hypothetical protein